MFRSIPIKIIQFCCQKEYKIKYQEREEINFNGKNICQIIILVTKNCDVSLTNCS